MSTRVEQLSEILESLQQPHGSPGEHIRGAESGFEFWRGATGATYVHSIYPLRACPQLPQANILLVHRSADGTKDVRHVGQTTHACPSSNLADVRQLASELGANEVHVHFLATDARERAIVTFDLEAWAAIERADNQLAN
ncbi:MAG: hypothetical protein AAFR23_06665 [Pseudomonadota bacterium]